MVVIDIETQSLPMEQIQSILPPFNPKSIGKHPGEFDESKVKHGATKDEAKRKAKTEDCRAKHLALIIEYEEKLLNGESDHWKSIQEDAALEALTGQVLAIGYSGKAVRIEHQIECSETDMLSRFWEMFTNCKTQGRQLVGFNLRGFDVPFLYQRSIILGIDIPKGVFNNNRFLSDTFTDLRDLWLGSSGQQKGKLDSICRACGIGSKPDGIGGEDFARLYRDETTRRVALDYLANDLAMTKALASRFGLS